MQGDLIIVLTSVSVCVFLTKGDGEKEETILYKAVNASEDRSSILKQLKTEGVFPLIPKWGTKAGDLH